MDKLQEFDTEFRKEAGSSYRIDSKQPTKIVMNQTYSQERNSRNAFEYKFKDLSNFVVLHNLDQRYYPESAGLESMQREKDQCSQIGNKQLTNSKPTISRS
ncbi:MAG: hypothetical protein EZS28_025048 [Streblomastix strix]|uniref:Uncharacterized protein n=1 Tax=Streblomastix strix TaxID=222440 RepID=A0A5J4VA88_9EUKA|nr:MAG: hypothetical protein EZS28_025048 [Streblomastix strix]